ncbi:hypothetical protein X975_04538, partial [Stegodyphus mimosarum]
MCLDKRRRFVDSMQDFHKSSVCKKQQYLSSGGGKFSPGGSWLKFRGGSVHGVKRHRQPNFSPNETSFSFTIKAKISFSKASRVF